jgi:hypothetical protein
MQMGKATGPRTPKGKARASQNAAKHWIKAGRILPEEEREAGVLRDGFTEDFKPGAVIELEIIDDLVLNRLIKRRIDIAFTREFAKARIEREIDCREKRESSAVQCFLRFADLRSRYLPGGEMGEPLRPDLCIEFLEDLKIRLRTKARGPKISGSCANFTAIDRPKAGLFC